MTYELCPQHSAENQRKIEAFAKANPNATVEQWERFFEKNLEWQINIQFSHCGANANGNDSAR